MSKPDFTASTGWPGLDTVLGGLDPGDNVVLGYESIDDYKRMVTAYDNAARLAGCRRVYFRFADHPRLLERMIPDVRNRLMLL
ncbi:MAG: hypothetical protein LR015_04765 [Verrucomicrobia bacterium]|nr:hypothetical protein [Verrucomicrobiota bacterium]